MPLLNLPHAPVKGDSRTELLELSLCLAGAGDLPPLVKGELKAAENESKNKFLL